jgi:hypothetical protein
VRRILSFSLAVSALLGAGLALAQPPEAASRPAAQRIAWSFDPVHGTMQPVTVTGVAMPPAAPARPAAETTSTAKTYTGVVDITFIVNLVSTRPANSVLRCTGSVGLALEEQATAPPVNSLILLDDVTAGESVDPTISGSTATCRFKIPYSWTVPASTSTTTIAVEGLNGAVGIASDQLDSAGAVIRTYRSNSTPLPDPIPLPQDSATVAVTVSTVL